MPKPVSAADIDAQVDKWFNEKSRNSAIARNTDAYNALFEGLKDLKAGLHKLLEAPAAVTETQKNDGEKK